MFHVKHYTTINESGGDYMKSDISWCGIEYHKCNNDYSISGYYTCNRQPNKVVVHFISGGFGCKYRNKLVFCTDICELCFSWLQNNTIDFNGFINDVVLVY